MYTGEFAKYTQFTGANVLAAPCQWQLGNAEHAHRQIKQAWTCQHPKDHLFQPRQAFGLNHAAAYIQDQARQRDLDRADGFAGITADTQALWPRICLQAMVKRRHDQPNRAAVDIAKSVTSDLLVGRADIRTSRAANAAQCVLEPGISSHLA